MTAIFMVALLAAAFGGFAWTAYHRVRLLMVGQPVHRFDRLFDRMAGAPDRPAATLEGAAPILLAAALPIVALGLGMAALLADPTDASPAVLFAAVGALASAGGAFLLWALRAQMKMPKYPAAGLAHYLIFTGFAVLLLRTMILVSRAFVPGFDLWVLDPAGPMPWRLLGVGYAVTKDVVIVGVLLGVLTFLRFRLLDRTRRLAYGWHAWVVLGVIATMMLADVLHDAGAIARDASALAGLTLDQIRALPSASGARAAALSCTGEHAIVGTVTAAWAADAIAWHEASPLGWLGARGFLALGLHDGTLLGVLSGAGYWLHVALVWGFLNYLPYGKHFHVITALPNVITRSLDAPGRLPPMATSSDELMEKVGATAEMGNPTDAAVGVARIEHFSRKALLDLYTCTECGRCSDNCPAHATGKLLSPKQLTIDLRDHLYGRADEFTKGSVARKTEGTEAPSTTSPWQPIDLVPAVIEPDVLWACTTCRACEEQCPVMITYVDKIVDMRRNLVLVKGEFPHELQKTFSALEGNGNPWNLTRMDRGAWTEKLDFPVPLMADKPDAEVLYWVGCAASYDDNAKKIAQATARLLHAAGVDFAILGSEETCTGDPARRSGNEYLYLLLAEQNVATLNKYKPRTILATCPHCFNSLLREYPDLGGRYDVVHHTDYLLGLLARGRLKPTQGVHARVAYHDSCYLGRYNNVYDSPREILRRIPGLEVVEVEGASREKGLCCGAGGGQMWMEEQNSDRVNKRRTLQLVDTGASTVASACPFCHTMLTDGLKALEGEPELGSRTIEQLDIAVILERSLGLGPNAGKSAHTER